MDGKNPQLRDTRTPLHPPALPRPEQTKAPAKRFILTNLFKPRTRPPSFILSVLVSTFKFAVIAVIALGMACVGLVVGIAKAYVETSPDLDMTALRDQDQTSFVYDRNGDKLTEWKGSENRVWAMIDEIPLRLQQAYIAQEDARYEYHNGIDIKRIAAAFLSNISEDTNTQGGSTITQQVVKNLMLNADQSYKRKIQEAKLAIELRSKTDKNDILEVYLNTISLGFGNYGVRTAAKYYFDKELNELTLRECACLAAITRNPGTTNPRYSYYTAKNTETRKQLLNERTDSVLDKMFSMNYITQEELEQGKRDQLVVVEDPPTTSMYKYAHAVEYALYDAAELLREKDGVPATKESRAQYSNELRKKGYHIYTTIDPEIQATVEDTVYNWDDYPTMAKSADSKKIERTNDGMSIELDMPQAAFVVYDYHSGEYLAIVGSRNAPQMRKTLNRAQVPRPVGSTIKPLAVYGPALEKGLNPASPCINIRDKIQGWNDGPNGKGYPANYGDDNRYEGVVSMRFALKKSLNIVAAHLLLDVVTMDRSIDMLSNLGVDMTRENPNRGPFSLCLGGEEIPMLEMAAAFGTIANKGVWMRPLAVSKITDSAGNTVLDAKVEQQGNKRTAMKPGTAFMLTDMLVEACRDGTGTAAAKGINVPVAGKTGTNSDARSVSFSGYTPYYSASVWVGHDDNKILGRTRKSHASPTGGSGAATIWNAVMKELHKGKDNKPIIEEDLPSLGLVKGEICGASGMPISANCPGGSNIVVDYYSVSTAESMTECTMHRRAAVCSVTHMEPTEYCPIDEYGSIFVLSESSPLTGISFEKLREFMPEVRRVGADGNIVSSGRCNLHTYDWYIMQHQGSGSSNNNNSWDPWGNWNSFRDNRNDDIPDGTGFNNPQSGDTQDNGGLQQEFTDDEDSVG